MIILKKFGKSIAVMKKERREVRNLILMLSSALFIVFVVVVGLVYYFGSSGTYLLRNVLISPEALERVFFDGKGASKKAVSPQSYAAFYELVASERSLPHVTDGIVAQFDQIVPSTLTIFRARDNSEKGDMVFQQIQFIDNGDLYRVQLRSLNQDKPIQEEWIYFRTPGIYKKVFKLFGYTPTFKSEA